MRWKPVSQERSMLFKGIAILMIMMHNFMHVFSGPKENEFLSDKENFISFLNVFITDPQHIFQASFSFLGHFGVQIFIFLSAYGLTKKFRSQSPTYTKFILKRIQTIYPSFILAILLWAMLLGWSKYGLYGPLEVLIINAESLLLKLTLLSNFTSNYALEPVGPWWFIPFIFQFYFVFPLLFIAYKRWGDLFLLGISLLSIASTIMLNGHIGGVNVYVTLLGHLPEFCLGMYLANHDDNDVNTPSAILLIALMIYIYGNIDDTLWYVNHLAFLIILLFVFNFLVNLINKAVTIKNSILFIGSISMYLFLINGFLRRPFIVLAEKYDNWLITIASSLLFLVACMITAIILLRVEKYLIRKTTAQLKRS